MTLQAVVTMANIAEEPLKVTAEQLGVRVGCVNMAKPASGFGLRCHEYVAVDFVLHVAASAGSNLRDNLTSIWAT